MTGHEESRVERGSASGRRRRLVRDSLGVKQTLFVALMVVLTSLALTVGSYYVVEKLLGDAVRHRLVEAADSRQRMLVAYVQQQHERVGLIASRTRLRQLLERYTDGQIDEATYQSASLMILEDARESSRHFVAIWVADTNGRVVASTDAARLGTDVSGEDAYQRGRTSSYMGAPAPSGTAYHAMLAAPMMRDGRLLGVVMVLLDAGVLREMMSGSPGGESGAVMIGKRVGDRTHYLLPTKPDGTIREALVSATPAMTEAIAGRRGFMRTRDYAGRDVLAAYTPVGYENWGLVVKVDTAEAYGPIRLFRQRAMLIATMVLIAVVVVSALIAGRMAKPITSLSHTAEEIAKGDLTARAAVTSTDEVGRLGEAFNAMARKLQQMRDDLEKRVAERTAELSRRNEQLIREMAERREAQEKLDIERHLLHTLLDNLPDRIFFKDRQSRFQRVSRSLAQRFGLGDPSQAVGKSDADFFSAEHAQKAFNDEQRLMTDGRPLLDQVEKETWPDGRTTWAITNKLPLFDQQGQVIGTFGISRDITKQVLAEEALKHSEQRTRLIVDTAYDGFVAMDEAGRVVEWNKQAEKMFGWSRDDALGRTVAELIVPPARREEHRAGLKRFIKTGHGPVLNQRIEVLAIRRDGSQFPVELTITPIKLGDHYLFGAFIRDITERKAAEAALRQAKEDAEAANRTKSEFLANMSHEIRTPMNGVIGMTELLLGTDLTPQQRDYLEVVKQSADTLLHLLNDILDFSKIEAGRLDLESIRFELRESIGDTLAALATRAVEKGLELACHIEPDVPEALVGDPVRLRQIIVNLVGNAIKFTEKGEVVLSVSKHQQTADRIELMFRVRDTGMGVEPEKLKLIFEAFRQADSSMSRRYGGTGLGLTIASQLVKLMGGRIQAESEPGVGSTFLFTAWFELPGGVLSGPPPEPPCLHGLRVLVVDDNATNRRILDQMLRSWKMSPTLASSGAEAMEHLRAAGEGQVDLIVCDVMMPGLDGFEFAAQVRADPRWSCVPIMLLTSAGRPEDRRRGENLRINACLMKPIKQSDLLDAISTVMEVNGRSALGSTAGVEPRPPGVASKRVLLVEDGVVNQRVATELLKRRGHSVTLATNGLEAIEQLRRESFDVVLMDVQMPHMDGLEATRAIRESEAVTGTHVPIIAMTAHAMKGDRERCLEAGMDGYVAKPIHAAQLYQAVESPHTLGDVDETPATRMGDEETCFDHAGAMSRVCENRAVLIELIDIFTQECPKLLDKIHHAITAKDAKSLRLHAHTLKGSAGVLSAGPVYEAAHRLELMGEQGRLDHADEAYAQLNSRVQKLLAALTACKES